MSDSDQKDGGAVGEDERRDELARPSGVYPPWIGGARFWILGALVVLLSFTILGVKHTLATRESALVPVVTMMGPRLVSPSEESRYVVLVRDRDGGPIRAAGVRVGFWREGFIELGRGSTSEAGETTIAIKVPSDFQEPRTLIAKSDVGVAEGVDAFAIEPKHPALGRVYVSTDKPLYQPGQTMHIRALAMAAHKPIASAPYTIEIRTVDGVKVFQEEKATSAFGVVSTDFSLADQVKLGRYTIVVREKGDKAAAVSGSRDVDVARYSLPKLKLDMPTVTDIGTTGLHGKARATWIFGEPVVKGRVTVTVDGWTGGETTKVEGVTDHDGIFSFDIPWRKDLSPALRQRGTFTLRGKVVAEGGMSAETSASVSTLAGGDVKLEAFPESGALVEGVPEDVWVLITGKGSESRDEPEVISIRADGVAPVKVSSRGIAKLRVVPPRRAKPTDPPRPFKIVAEGDHGSEGSIELTPTNQALVIRSEHDEVSAGAPLKVQLLGADPADFVSVRLTKSSLLLSNGTCEVRQERGCEVTLTAPADAEPGLATLSALTLPRGKSELRTSHRLVMIGAGTRDLAIKLAPDKQVYAPRDRGTVDVAVTTPSGDPVKAELGVAVADEAVFALADVRPDLEKLFFSTDHEGAMGRSATGTLPGGLDVKDAYDTTADADVRATVLAALSAHVADDSGLRGTSATEVRERALEAVRARVRYLSGWAIVLVAIWAAVAFLGFAVYGWSRFVSSARVSEPDVESFRVESRGLYIDWLMAILGPVGLSLIIAAMASVLDVGLLSEKVFAVWATLAAFFAITFVRAILRVRRTTIARGAPAFVRALTFLPIAAFLANLAVVLVLLDRGARLDWLFPTSSSDKLVLPLAVTFAAQLSCGAMSVVRQTLLRDVPRRRRHWLFWSRASFVGLPLVIGLLGFVGFEHLRRSSRASWRAFEEIRLESIEDVVSDNKEGGTGTRARGEEGSMGNPAAALGGHAAAKTREPSGHVRSDFPETLLWAPQVMTDESGHAKIVVPFADSITTWRFGLRGVGVDGRLGSTTLPLIVKQDFFVEAHLPPTLTQGDQIAMPISVFSYGGSPEDVLLEVEGEGISSATPRALIHLAAKEARGVRVMIKADAAGDRVVRVKATSGRWSDVLEKKISVTPNGQRVVHTTNRRLTAKSVTDLELPAQTIDGGNDLFVKIYGGPLSLVSESLDGVFTMPHGCFEQTSSVTYPSVLALDLLKRTGTTSADVERRARRYIGEGYQRIVSFEVSRGGFSLFGDAPADVALTAYGLLELSDMAVVVPALVDRGVLDRARQFLYSQASSTHGFARATPGASASDPKTKSDEPLVTAYAAWALAAAARLPETEQDSRLSGVLDAVARADGPSPVDPYVLALRANALLAGNRNGEARKLVDQLVAMVTRSEDGSEAHWTSRSVGVMGSYGPSMDVEVTGLAAHAMARLGVEPALRDAALAWLVSQRSASGVWSTTQATIAALRALTDDARPVPREPQDVLVVVDGEPQGKVTLEPGSRDVHHLVSLRSRATPGRHTVTLSTSTEADVSVQIVERHYLPWQRAPAGTPSPLTLDVAYEPHDVEVGVPVACHVRAAWSGSEPARMPLIEVGVPPAFEVDTTELDKRVADPQGRIRRYSVDRDRVTLYLVELPPSEPLTVDLPMRASRPVRVTVPSSTAYLYYEPEVAAETQPASLRAF